MKTFSILLLAGLLPLSATAGAASPAPAETACELTAAELMTANALQKVATILSSVNDRATADAAATAVRTLCAGLNALAAGDPPQWDFTPAPMSPEMAEKVSRDARLQVDRLRGEAYYGSVALAEAVGDEPGDAELPSPEQLAALKMIAAKIRQVNAVLRQVQDKTTADAAAVEVLEILSSLLPMTQNQNFKLPRRKLEDCMLLVGMSREEQRQINREERRLQKEYYYGSVALARALGKPASAAELPAEK